VEYKGYLEIPNLSDENEASELDITLCLESSGPHEEELRHLIRNEVDHMVRTQLATYIRELKEEFSKGLILPTDKPKPQIVCKGKTVVDRRSFQNQVVTSGDAKKSPSTSSSTPYAGESVAVTTISLSDTFKVPPDRLYEVFAEKAMVEKWSNSVTQLDFRVGGNFSMFGGMVTGTFLKLVTGREMEMHWRLKTYPEGHFARITFTFKDAGDSTDLSIEAVDVPRAHVDETERGLRQHYMENIMRTFGFRARIV